MASNKGTTSQRYTQDSGKPSRVVHAWGWQHGEPWPPPYLQGGGCPERVGMEGLLHRGCQGLVLSVMDTHPVVLPPFISFSCLELNQRPTGQGAAGANSTGQGGEGEELG